MSKKRHLTVPFNKQHGEQAQILFKYERRHFYHIYRSLRRQLSLKKSLLVIWKILRLFVKIFTANDKYSLLNRDNLMQLIQMQLSQKSKSFLNFFLNFWNLHCIFNSLEKKITLIANVFPKLRTSKNVVR